ncbi:hypothetical protein EFL67_10715 [Weissella confusa]|nr:hypothetical protein [Weissella confusa]
MMLDRQAMIDNAKQLFPDDLPLLRLQSLKLLSWTMIEYGVTRNDWLDKIVKTVRAAGKT